jgi:hypothetical protein
MNRSTLFALIAFPMLACSSSLTSLQPAAVLGKGQFHTGTGIVVPAPVSAALKFKDASANGIDQKGLGDAAFAAVANLPFPLTQTDVRMGFGHNFDAGIRISTDAISLGGKYQFIGNPKPGGFDGSVGLELSRHVFDNEAYANAVETNNALNLLNIALFGIEDLQRIDVTIPVLFGRQPTSWLNYWWGPKYSFSHIDLTAAVNFGDDDDDVNENLHYFGGTAGAAFGYKRAWMIVELTALDLIFKPEVGGQTFDAGGLVIFPALGFMTRF